MNRTKGLILLLSIGLVCASGSEGIFAQSEGRMTASGKNAPVILTISTLSPPSQLNLALGITNFVKEARSEKLLPNLCRDTSNEAIRKIKDLVPYVAGKYSGLYGRPQEGYGAMAVLGMMQNRAAFFPLTWELRGIGSDKYPKAGNEAAGIVLRFIGRYAPRTKVEQALERALADSNLDVPASLTALYDGIRNSERIDRARRPQNGDFAVP